MSTRRPDLPDAATALRSAEAWARADAQLAAWLGTGQRAADALQKWGSQLLRANRVEDAATAFRAALALAPDSAALWTNLGMALNRSGSVADAVACFAHSVGLDPKQPDTWLLSGLAKKQLGELRGAESDYRTALGLQPSSWVVWQCLGLLKQEQRDYALSIECFEACVKLAPSVAVWANLGKLYYQVGRIHDARAAYALAAAGDPANTHYRRMHRRAVFLHEVLSGSPVTDALAAYASKDPKDAYDGRELAPLLEHACGHLGNLGQMDVAIRLARKRLELWPDSASAAYLLQALQGESGVRRSPREYLVESFDAFAETFDATLVEVLGYDVPEKLCSVVRQAGGNSGFVDVLDAGCGTGLCGPLLRPLARELTGVDLSSKMLERASQRGAYDNLVCEDLAPFLSRFSARFDLIVAADVMIYFGELAPLFASALVALKPGGVFAFSTEYFAGDEYRLQPSGRFAHAPSYVRSSAGSNLVEELCTETTIRLEGAERVRGNLYVFRRRGLQDA